MSARHRLDTARCEIREIDGELVILDLESQRYMGTNRTATQLWPLLERGASVDELAEALQAAFGIDAERAAVDAAAFVEGLEQFGLLGPAE